MAIALRDISTFREERVGYSARSPSRSMDIWIRGDLLASKPRRAMGEAIWLYLYLKSRAGFETGRVDRYNHSDAAEYLDASDRTIRGWMERLINLGYVMVTHHRYYLTVETTNFVPQSIRVAERRRPQAGMDPEPPPAPSPAEYCRPNLPSPAESCHSESARTAESCRKDGRILPSVRSNVSSNDPGRDRGSSKDRSRRQSPPAAAFLIEPDIPPILQSFHPLLAGQRGYNPTPAHLAHLASIAQKLPALDLECEALKIIDWLDQSKNRTRQCSFAFVANWLKRAADDPSKSTNRASPPAPRPPEIEDGETYYRRLLATGQPNGDDPRE